MKKNIVIKTKADYKVFSNKHKKLSDGVIYENNIMTISKFDELFTEEANVYSDFGFRFAESASGGLQRKHIRGGLLSESECNSLITNNVQLKANSELLSDYAYYGSAALLVKSSITNIIKKFPGELFFSKTFAFSKDGVTYFLVKNPFEIDIDTLLVNENVENKLRFFASSISEFELILGTNSAEIIPESLTINKIGASCEDKLKDFFIDSTVEFDIELVGGVKHCKLFSVYCNGIKSVVYTDESFTNYSLRPKTSYLTEFYSSLSGIEALFVNRDTLPLYTVQLREYKETEYGIRYELKPFTWPSINNYNPLVSGALFQRYFTGLIDLCNLYDEYYCQNIWRTLTHESLKTLDWTFINNGTEERIDGTRMEAISNIYGRVYDDIKGYIDGLKTINTITYNDKNSMPDYFVSKKVNNLGFDSTLINITDDCDLRTERLYASTNKTYGQNDASLSFLKYISLNSKYLNSIKGTRNGIVTMLKMFGLEDDEFSISEHVAIASANGIFGNKNNQTMGVAYPSADSIEEINKLVDLRSHIDLTEETQGLPLNVVTVIKNDDIVKYVVPWFSDDKEYDGGLYFQMNGGWLNRISMDVNLTMAPGVNKITSDSETQLYGENKNIIKFVGKLTDILNTNTYELIKGDLVYVYDIEEIRSDYNFGPSESGTNYSHYFILEDSNLHKTLGYDVASKAYGWRNIKESEYSNKQTLTSAGKRVLFYETITDDTEGNAPHFGNGKYDNGKEYLDYMALPFKYCIDNNLLSNFTQQEVDEIRKIKFTLNTYLDNKKCWYFSNTKNIDDRLFELKKDNNVLLPNRVVDICNQSCSGVCDYMPFNPEYGAYNDTSAANSVINVKNIEIKINVKRFKVEFSKFFNNSLLKYLTHMIPSTCICTLIMEGVDEEMFTVTFIDEINPGPSGEIISVQNVDYGDGAIDPYKSKEIMKEGYTFIGWDKKFDYVTNNMTVYALYHKNTFTVRFLDDNNNLIKIQTVETSECPTAPVVMPVVKGNVFDKWTLSGETIENVNSYPIYSNTDFIATYTKGKYTVTYVINETEYEEVHKNVKYNTKIPSFTGSTTIEGFEFVGWKSSVNGITPSSKMPGCNVAFTAQYKPAVYKVVFMLIDNTSGQETYECVSVQYVNYGESAIQPSITLEVGKTISGWDKDFSFITSNMTISTYIVDVLYNLTFEGYSTDGGTPHLLVETDKFKYNEVVSGFTRESFDLISGATCDGYKFLGTFNGLKYDELITNMPDYDITYVGDYEFNKYKLHWIISAYTGVYLYGDYTEGDEIPYLTPISTPKVSYPMKYDIVGWKDEDGEIVTEFPTNMPSNDLNYYLVLEEVEYTVTYDLVIMEGYDETLYKGEIIERPETPEKVGYEFNNWYADSGYTEPYKFNTIITSDVTVYAGWTCTVKFVTNTTTQVDDQYPFYGSKIELPYILKDNYVLKGWKKPNGELWDENDVVTESITLTAYWEKQTYTVTFDGCGYGENIPAPSGVTYGDKIEKPANPTGKPEEYEFSGWYKDLSYSDGWDFDEDIVLGDTILYAKWDFVTRLVTFFSKLECSNLPSPIKVKINHAIGTLQDPNTNNYTFNGWYTDSACTEGNEWDLEEDKVTEDLTLYAKWDANDVIVTFNYNNYPVEEQIQTEYVPYGELVAEPIFEKDDRYEISGWTTTDTEILETRHWLFNIDRVYGPTTLTLDYYRVKYLVEFNLNGYGSEEIESQYVSIGGTATEPEEPTSEFHEFSGWYTDSACTKYNKWNFDTVVTDDMTLYAKWKLLEYVVTYQTNGGSVISPSIVPAGNKISRPEDPIKEGSRFLGWYKDSGCTEGNEWDFDEDIVINDMTLYAKWVTIYVVIFDCGFNTGATAPRTQVVEAGNTLLNVTPSGNIGVYVFDGWYTDSGCTEGNKWDFSTPVNSNMTLYADWDYIRLIIDLAQDTKSGNYGLKLNSYPNRNIESSATTRVLYNEPEFLLSVVDKTVPLSGSVFDTWEVSSGKPFFGTKNIYNSNISCDISPLITKINVAFGCNNDYERYDVSLTGGALLTNDWANNVLYSTDKFGSEILFNQITVYELTIDKTKLTNHEYHINPIIDKKVDYLSIKPYDNEVTFVNNGCDVEYSINTIDWTKTKVGDETGLPYLYEFYLRGTNKDGLNYKGNISKFNITTQGTKIVKAECSGNIMSLIHPSISYIEIPVSVNNLGCFEELFSGCNISTMPELTAIKLSENCYKKMFSGSALEKCNYLPAQILANNCYSLMFNACQSLTTPPIILPATTLANNCYNYMFSECILLKTTPWLPAMNVDKSAYNGMFERCTSLASIKCFAVAMDSGSSETWLGKKDEILDCPSLTEIIALKDFPVNKFMPYLKQSESFTTTPAENNICIITNKCCDLTISGVDYFISDDNLNFTHKYGENIFNLNDNHPCLFIHGDITKLAVGGLIKYWEHGYGCGLIAQDILHSNSYGLITTPLIFSNEGATYKNNGYFENNYNLRLINYNGEQNTLMAKWYDGIYKNGIFYKDADNHLKKETLPKDWRFEDF